ncbi:MAG: P-II family nitrogen regulator [Balneolaceae bacterium]
MEQKVDFNLIVSIINKGHCGTVIDASRSAGAEGGTIINGRGSGIHEKAKLFSFSIEPEKDIVLTLVPKEITETVLEAIVKAVNLNEPGNGIAFIIEVEKTAGINHPVQLPESQNKDSNS